MASATDNPSPYAPDYDVIVAKTKEEIQQCFDVRIAVFVHEQRFPLEVEIDE
jgi:predicted GNAT family N-acyltransferase